MNIIITIMTTNGGMQLRARTLLTSMSTDVSGMRTAKVMMDMLKKSVSKQKDEDGCVQKTNANRTAQARG